MKLLIVANYAKEHINKFHLSTIRKFREAGWQVDVACNADEEVPGADHLYHIPCQRNPFRPQSVSCIRSLKKLIGENGYDVVHCHTLTGRILGTLAAKSFKKKGLKLVVTYHGLNYYRGSSAFSKLLIPLDRYLARFADLSFSDNMEDLQYMQSHGYRLGKTCFCPPSINRDKYRDVDRFAAQRDETRHSLGFTKDNVVLTYVAELNENKNQALLLQMFEMLQSRYPQARLLLIGPDHSDGQIRKQIDDRGLQQTVTLTGWRNDVCRLLTACDVYVASSIREGFGVNLLEAAICGLPIVATDNRGHREIIVDHYNGVLVPLGNAAAFAGNVAQIIAQPELAKTLVENGRRRFHELFSTPMEETIYAEYLKLLTEE